MDPVSAALPQNLRRFFVATLEQGLQEGMGEIVFKVRKCSVRGLVLVSNNQTTRVMISSNFIFNIEDGEGVEAEVVEEDLEDEASL